MKTLFKQARILDPASKKDEIGDVLINGNIIGKIDKQIEIEDAEIINAEGLWLLPGLVDSHVHLREPGQEGKETIATGTKAAAAGGITTVVCMPNTSPPIDDKTQVEFIIERSLHTGCVRVYPTGALTKNLEGKEISPMGEMVDAGAVAISDDAFGLMDSQVLRRAMEYTTIFDVPIILHSEDHSLTEGGSMHEGLMSMKMGILGIPCEAEAIHVARNIHIAHLTGAKLHLAHISCEKSIDLIRFYKAKNYPVTAEVTPHHLLLTDEAVDGYITDAKMRPPLRTPSDIDSLFEGLRDGTIDCITSDHAPHTQDDKNCEFPEAPFGVSGLETLLPLVLGPILEKSGLDILDILAYVTLKPAQIMKLPGGRLYEGGPADITLWDPEPRYNYDVNNSFSKSKNNPFHGWPLKGRVNRTYCAGKEVYAYTS